MQVHYNLLMGTMISAYKTTSMAQAALDTKDMHLFIIAACPFDSYEQDG